jgi:hypothetical protein
MISIRSIISLLAMLLAISHAAALSSDSPSEYELKAAFLYNFTLYIEWPSNHSGPFRLCVYGENPFADHLDALHGKNIDDRIFEIHYRFAGQTLHDCQLVFVAQSARGQIAEIVTDLRSHPVLTVSDIPDAVHHGIMLGLFEKNERIAFKVNLRVARQQGLTMSSKLLRLATEVVK